MMKKTLFIFSFLLAAVVGNAQDLIKSASYYTYDGIQYDFLLTNDKKPNLLFPIPGKTDCSIFYIEFTEKNASKLIDMLTEDTKKMDEWQQTAQSENVRDFDKNLEEGKGLKNLTKIPMVRGGAIVYNGAVIDIKGSNAAAALGVSSATDFHHLYIDNSGKCFIKMSIATEMTLTKGVSQVIESSKGGTLTVEDTRSIKPQGVIYMDKAQLSQVITALIDAQKELAESKNQKQTNKEKSKLFK